MDFRYREEGFLRKHYQVEGRSCAAIGRMCGVSRKTIHNWLQRLGIPVRSPSTAMVRRHRKDRVKDIDMRELLTDDINLDAEPLSPGEVKRRMDQYHRDRDGKRKKTVRERMSKEIIKERKERLMYHGEDEAAQQLEEIQRDVDTPNNVKKRKSGLKT